MKFLYLAFSITLILCGCSSHPSRPMITDNFKLFDLTATPKENQNRLWLEKFSIDITIKNGQRVRQELLLQTEFTTSNINIVALSLEGFPLVQASWDIYSHELKVEQLINTALTEAFDIKKIIHDLQAAHWPLKRIKRALNSQYSVSEVVVNNEKIRRFYHQNKVIMTIRKKAKQTKLTYLNLNYEVSIIRLKDKSIKNRL